VTTDEDNASSDESRNDCHFMIYPPMRRYETVATAILSILNRRRILGATLDLLTGICQYDRNLSNSEDDMQVDESPPRPRSKSRVRPAITAHQ
jgi:hypothetical protein